MAVINEVIYLETFSFRDLSESLITTETNGDFTKKVVANGSMSVTPVSVSQVGTSGLYTPSLTPDALGYWTVIIEWIDDPGFSWTYWFKVEPVVDATIVSAINRSKKRGLRKL